MAGANEHGVDARWITAEGKLDYPTNNGFSGTPKNTTLKAGETFDRYGGYIDDIGKFKDTGRFSSPVGTSFSERALPKSALDKEKRTYEILKPIPNVKSGKAEPWFGEVGGGTQYQLPMSIDDLIRNGFIKRL